MGFDADLAVIDPGLAYTLRAEDLYYKNPFSAYEGRRIGCRVVRTFVRGHEVYSLKEGFTARAGGRRIIPG